MIFFSFIESSDSDSSVKCIDLTNSVSVLESESSNNSLVIINIQFFHLQSLKFWYSKFKLFLGTAKCIFQ